MRAVVGLLALCAVSAQASEIGLAMQRAMHVVCDVSRDSRQCETMQLLYAEQVDLDRSDKQAPPPRATPEARAEIRTTIKTQYPQLEEPGFMLVEAMTLRAYLKGQGR